MIVWLLESDLAYVSISLSICSMVEIEDNILSPLPSCCNRENVQPPLKGQALHMFM